MANLLKIYIVSIAIVVMATTTALAQSGSENQSATSEHQQNVEQILGILNLPAQIDKTVDEVISIYTAKPATLVGDDVQKLLDSFYSDVSNILNSALGWDALRNTYIDLYASKLSETEVAEILSFLQSTAGQSFVDSQFFVSTEMKSVTKHQMAGVAERIKALTNLLREEIAALQVN